MSKPTVLPGQLTIDFDAPPLPPPVQVLPQPPRRPTFLEIYAQRLRIDRVAKALEAKVRAVPQKSRRAWIVRDEFGVQVATRIDRMLADVPDLEMIAHYRSPPGADEMWDAMRELDVPHGACRLERCHRTRRVILLADMTIPGRFEERLDAI